MYVRIAIPRGGTVAKFNGFASLIGVGGVAVKVDPDPDAVPALRVSDRAWHCHCQRGEKYCRFLHRLSPSPRREK
jgi:hypothetical protein